MSRRAVVYPTLAAAVALPRLAVLLYERDDLLASFVEKSDTFARVFVESGTYGFIPGVPSAYTQPLYGFVLVPVYTIHRSWLTVGVLHILLAIGTAWLVYELGRRFVSPPTGLVAAVILALNPYLVWHDVHVNREVVDGLVAAALVLAAMLAATRRSFPLAALGGALAGVAILGNARLIALPLLLAAFVGWRVRSWREPAVLLVAAAVALAPWVVRNEVQLGCFAITTDARALWKANNENTDEVLAIGGWIDDVPPLPGAPLNPDEAGDIYRNEGRIVDVDECEQMDLYRDEVVEFWREHPGEKGELAARALGMLWDPRVTQTDRGPGAGTWLESTRTWVGGAFFSALFLLALLGAPRLPRPLLVLTVSLLAYQTLMAMVFVGATRYRAPWDFLLAVPAAAALVALVRRFR